jgi:hypothetical protein
MKETPPAVALVSANLGLLPGLILQLGSDGSQSLGNIVAWLLCPETQLPVTQACFTRAALGQNLP